MTYQQSWWRHQSWINSPGQDLIFIISPAFLITFLVLAFPSFFVSASQLPLWLWAMLIIGIDVAHVYATLFRTYWRPKSIRVNKHLLLWVPFCCWVIGIILYAIDGMLFWRGLTYLAVFHFIRQQYGFMAIYSRKNSEPFKTWGWLDTAIIYLATIYPLVYWHAHLPRNFNWFIEGDFIPGLSLSICFALGIVYLGLGLLYCAKESVLSLRHHQFNVPKNLLILGTAISWYVGIIQLNADMAFTATNVISHGIPYMALVWFQNKRLFRDQNLGNGRRILNKALSLEISVLGFIFILLLLAWLEEGLWDGFIWREHLALFTPFTHLPYHLSTWTLTWLVPFLAMPQAAHYVFDGFIWRMNGILEYSNESGLVVTPLSLSEG